MHPLTPCPPGVMMGEEGGKMPLDLVWAPCVLESSLKSSPQQAEHC